MKHDYDFYIHKITCQRGINKIWEYVCEDCLSYKGSNTLLSRIGEENPKLIEHYHGEVERPCPLSVERFYSIFLFNIGNTIQAKKYL